jgi:hypothetical protein
MIEQTNARDEQLVRVPNKKPKSKKPYVFIGILLLVVVVGSVFSVTGYKIYNARYHHDQFLVQTGIQDLRKAEALLAAYPKNFFDDRPVNQARQELANALPTFEQLATDLKSLPEISSSVPVYGTQLSVALQLVPIAIEVSQAGLLACNTLALLISRFHNPISNKGQSLSMADFTTVNQNFHQIEMVFNGVIGQLNQVKQGIQQLDPHLTLMLGTFEKEIPTLQASLNTVEKLLPVVPTLLGVGTPTNYLVEILDSTELRPGGGFIGNYGITTLTGGRISAAQITDSYLLDKPFVASGPRIPFPPAYAWFNLSPEGWSFRDSNLDADFPTVAHNAEQIYKEEGGNENVQGLIAITPALIQHMLTITGPIAVPEYHKIVTAQNMIDLIHFYQLGGPTAGEGSSLIASNDGLSSQRKHFVALLGEYFIARMRHLPSTSIAKVIQALGQAIRTKDLQVYFNLSAAENLLSQYHLDGSIQQTKGDSFFVVNANISPNKANDFITNTYNDQVAIDAQGNVTHHATITYAWTKSGKLYGSSVYKDYMRVYVPSDSNLLSQVGWESLGTTMAFGHKVWAGYFTLVYGQTRVITLIWSTAHLATHNVHGWHYQQIIQRQAGAAWKMNEQITLPTCAGQIYTSGVPVATDKQKETVTNTLIEDINLKVDYVC